MFPCEPDAAQHLDALGGDEVRTVAREGLRRRRGNSPAGIVVVDGGGGEPDRGPGRFEGHEGIGHTVLDGLERTDLHAELLAGGDVVDVVAKIDPHVRPARRPREDRPIEGVADRAAHHRIPGSAEHIGTVHHDTVEHDRGQLAGLVERADRRGRR